MKTLTLRRYKGRESLTVLVDDEDYEYLSKFAWWRNFHGYIVGRIDGKECYMHRVIMDEPTDKIVDHINGNKLDNRRGNLRLCTRKENVRNSKLSSNNTSGISGISFRQNRNKYRAYIMVNRKQITLGHYANIEDAITARKEAECKYFGEFAPTHD